MRTGCCSADLATRDPGPINHSRWLTTANRVLRLYIATERPSDGLQCIVQFIMKVYAPMWFRIKKFWSCLHGPEHVYETLRRIEELHPQFKDEVLLPVVQRNCYFAHPENILLTMVNDSDASIRKLGWSRILDARRNEEQAELQPKRKRRRPTSRSPAAPIRQFRVPKLKKKPQNYRDLVNWNQVKVTEPPFTKKYSIEDLVRFEDESAQRKTRHYCKVFLVTHRQ